MDATLTEDTTSIHPISEQRVTVADLIREEAFPLPQLVSLLLKIGCSAMSCRVEMEFALGILICLYYIPSLDITLLGYF
jgi:hypothetical protein